MYNEKIENLISAALADGELTEKEKQILFKRAEEQGVDLDEFEMVLNARLFEKQKELKSSKPNASPAPQSNRHGDIRKCPSCGAMIESFQTKCSECGYEFRNVGTVTSAQKLFDLLQEAEMRKTDRISAYNIEKERRLQELSVRHNSDGSLVKILGGKSRKEIQDEEREVLIRELNDNLKKLEQSAEQEQMTIIKSFPVPNTAEDLIELLAMATSNAYDNDGYIGLKEEAWIQKTDQIYQKIVAYSSNDKPLLKKATNMVTALMRRLPNKANYKQFTKIPPEMRSMVQEELKAENKQKFERDKKLILSILKTYGIITGIILLAGVIFSSLLEMQDIGSLCILVAGGVSYLGYRAWKRKKDELQF